MSLAAPPLPPLQLPSAKPDRISAQGDDARLMSAAKAMEASFLAQMLKLGGLDATPEGFGGGVGEDQFAGLMSQIRAEQIVESGGIGLAEQIFEDLKGRSAQ